MSSNTKFLDLLMKDPVADKDDTFNIETMLNENWRKIDTAVKSLAETEFESLKGYLKINAIYSSTGQPAENVYFRGIPDVDEALLRTDSYGQFYAALPVGTYTLTFRTIIGELQIPDQTVDVVAKTVAEVPILIEAGAELKHITESNEYLVGQDAAETEFFAIGGGGSGGIAGCRADANGLVAAGGGGGGFVSQTLADLTPLRGTFLTILVGAGGKGVTMGSITGKCQKENGNTGGATEVTSSDGTVLVTAKGGFGGEGASDTNCAGATALGGEGTCSGGSIRLSSGHTNSQYWSEVTFYEDNIEGVHVFGDTDYPLVGGGGSAKGSFNSNQSQELHIGNRGAGCNEDGTTVDGTGAGSSASVSISSNSGRSSDGASGAVFIR